MKTSRRTYTSCDNSGDPHTLSSGTILSYDNSGDCYISTSRVDLARIEEKDPNARPALVFVPGPGVDPVEIDQVDTCPTGNTGTFTYTAGGSTGSFTLDFSVPSTAGTEWGWDFFGGRPPKLKIKVRIKRPV